MEKVAMKDELEKGHEFAKQLGRMILKSSSDGEDEDSWTTSYAQDLVAKMLDSFTNAILLFNNHRHPHHVSADSLPPNNNSHKSHHQSPSKSKNPTTVHLYGTTCSPKKRKLNTLITWEEDSKISPKQDGYVWRKYGEKITKHAQYPRSYFRCSYKHEQGCEAIKQVQRIQDDPPLFRTTYFGYHTCSNIHMFDNSDDLSTSSFIISFHHNNNNNNNNTPHNNITTFHLQKNNVITFLPSMRLPTSSISTTMFF